MGGAKRGWSCPLHGEQRAGFSLLPHQSPVTRALCSLCLSGSCGRSCKDMVQKYQPPVRVHEYPFELVMAVSDPWFPGPK